METAPLYEEVARAPEGGAAYWLTCPDGVRIRLGHWATGESDAKGTVLLFPGRTEYIEKYGPAAGEFTAAGFDMIAVDWRGQGIADRAGHQLLGHVGHFDEFQVDVDTVMAAVREMGLPEPYYLIGHSMGGAIGLRALHRVIGVNAAVFSGPMWGISLSPLLRPIAWTMSWAFHKLGSGLRLMPGTSEDSYVRVAPFEDNQLTKDREMWDFMRHQIEVHPDLALGGPSFSWLSAALIETQALRRMSPPPTPALTFLGADERIVATQAVHDVMNRWDTGELVIVPAGEHETMMEVPATRDLFYGRSVAHFEAHR